MGFWAWVRVPVGGVLLNRSWAGAGLGRGGGGWLQSLGLMRQRTVPRAAGRRSLLSE